MCMTRMSTFAETEVITVTPLRTFPVIRDLVTDVAFNYTKAREIPAFAPPPELAPGEYRMQQVDVERSQEFRKCIECYLCQNTCHVVRDHEENKPRVRRAALPHADRRSWTCTRSTRARTRRRRPQEEHGLGYCNITKCCTEVCPEHIKITDNALIPLKERVVDRKYDPLVWLGSKIFKRSARLVRRDRSTPAASAAPPEGAADLRQLRLGGLLARGLLLGERPGLVGLADQLLPCRAPWRTGPRSCRGRSRGWGRRVV